MRGRGCARWGGVLGVVVAGVMFAGVGSAWGFAPGSSPGVGWALTARTYPSYFAPGSEGTIYLDVFNVGQSASIGAITVTDVLPRNVFALEAGTLITPLGTGVEDELGGEFWACTGNGPGEAVAGASVVTCTNTANLEEYFGGGGHPNGVREPKPDQPHLQPPVLIKVQPAAGAEGTESNRATIAGGGAAGTASTSDPVTVSSGVPAFGFRDWNAWVSSADGSMDTRAGSHPYNATFSFDFNNELIAGGEALGAAGGEARAITVDLPPGLVVNPAAVPQCPREVLLNEKCPAASQVGDINLRFAQAGELTRKLFNMVPPKGVPGEIGTNFSNVNSFIDGQVRSGSDYGISASANNIPQREIIGTIVTLWGTPGDPSHDAWRTINAGGCAPGQCGLVGSPIKPYLTLSTSCGEPPQFAIRAVPWGNPTVSAQSSVAMHDNNELATGFTNCDGLGFEPLITLAPETSNTDTPTGLTAVVKPVNTGLGVTEGISTSALQKAKVTLPEGLAINPGQAAGLKACGQAESAVGTDGAPACPLASKIGTDTIKSPESPGGSLNRRPFRRCWPSLFCRSSEKCVNAPAWSVVEPAVRDGWNGRFPVGQALPSGPWVSAKLEEVRKSVMNGAPHGVKSAVLVYPPQVVGVERAACPPPLKASLNSENGMGASTMCPFSQGSWASTVGFSPNVVVICPVASLRCTTPMALMLIPSPDAATRICTSGGV